MPILRRASYQDDHGRIVNTLESLDVYASIATGKQFEHAFGSAMLTSDVPTPQGLQKVQRPFTFPIEANTLEEAFANFEKSAHAEIERMKEEAQKEAREAATGLVLPNHIKKG
jgi:hypothetical protein